MAGNGADLIAAIRELDELAPDYEIVLDEIATALQRIAVIQLAGGDAVEDEDELESLIRLAGEITAECVQLYYQIAVTSRRDLALAPDPRLGFEMALLRMLAFKPAVGGSASVTRQAAPVTADPSRPPVSRAQAAPVRDRKAAQPRRSASPPQQPSKPASPAVETSGSTGKVSVEDINDWPDFVAGLSLGGAASQLAAHSAIESSSPFEICLCVERSNEHLLTDNLKSRLTTAIQQRIGSGIAVQFSVTNQTLETAAARVVDHSAQAKRKAQDVIDNDPDVQQLVDIFAGEVVPDSIQSVDREPPSR